MPHNTKKCFPPYPDHYLTFIVLQIAPFKGIREIFASGIRNSGILSKESGILGFGIWNRAQGIRNPRTTDKDTDLESSTWNLESKALDPESKTTLDCLTWGNINKAFGFDIYKPSFLV